MHGKEQYLLLLYNALIGIRSLEGEEVSKAPAYAYILHNVPFILLNEWDAEREQEMLATIKSRAEHFGVWDEVEQWIRNAQSRLENNSKLKW